jgi:site-specific recombinase
MGLQDLIIGEPRLALKIINILCHILLNETLVMQHLAEMMSRRSIKLVQTQERLRQFVKRLRLLLEVVDIENGLSIGQIILLEIVVEASAWRSEVGDASTYADACTCENHNFLEFLSF